MDHCNTQPTTCFITSSTTTLHTESKPIAAIDADTTVASPVDRIERLASEPSQAAFDVCDTTLVEQNQFHLILSITKWSYNFACS